MNSVTAIHWVHRLLETTPYDVDDPLDREDPAFYPAGFTAERDNGDRRILRLSLKDSNRFTAVYRLETYWQDEYTGQERALHITGIYHVRPDTVHAWLAARMEEWRAGGWTVTKL